MGQGTALPGLSQHRYCVLTRVWLPGNVDQKWEPSWWLVLTKIGSKGGDFNIKLPGEIGESGGSD